MKRIVCVVVAVLVLTAGIDARKSSSGRSRGSSSRGTSRRTNYNPQPAPTSFSNPAPKSDSSLFGWQTKAKETPVRSAQAGVSHQSRASQPSHSYPSSQTGLSGNQQPPSYQQAVQQSHSYPQNSKPQQAHTYPQSGSPQQQSHSYPQSNSQPGNTQGHAYPASGGLSGHSGAGASYPAQSGGGLSGASAPAYPGGQAARPSAPGGYPVGAAGAGAAYPANNYGNSYHPPAHGPPPAYPGNHAPGYGSPGYGNPGYGHAGNGGGGYGGNGGYGGMGGYGGGGFGGAGGFGGYNNGKYGGMSRGTSTLAKVGIAGAGVGTLLTGLALWNLARSGSHRNTHIYQDHRGNPIPVPMNDTAPAMDPILGELVNCTLTVNGANATEVFGIPCAIATSFSPNQDLNKGVDTSGTAEEAKCIITVVTKNGTELSTTIPCSILLNTAKEANVTEPPPLAMNGTDIAPGIDVNGSDPALSAPLAPYPGMGYPGAHPVGVNESGPLAPPLLGVPLAPFPVADPAQHPDASNAFALALNTNSSAPDCKLEPGSTPDPINPCLPMNGDVSVIPLAPANSTPQTAAAA